MLIAIKEILFIIIMSNSPQFLEAAEAAKNLTNTPDHDTLASLYGLYKQATVGDNTTPKPNFLDFKGNKKWDGWNKYKGYSKKKAEYEYVVLVNNLN
jgi:diazepam-binding inhibitor (GABA receptor modulating acyl-CoA-binding protein)